VIECFSCDDEREHHARGLCRACYKRLWRAGTLDEWPPVRGRRSGNMVTDAKIIRMRQPALSWPTIATMLGVKPKTLDKARERSRAREAA
jgi:hypothetical protein